MSFCLFTVCKDCPAGTEPVLGYEYKWWNVLPTNMKTSCFNVGNANCDDMNGEYGNTQYFLIYNNTDHVGKLYIQMSRQIAQMQWTSSNNLYK